MSRGQEGGIGGSEHPFAFTFRNGVLVFGVQSHQSVGFDSVSAFAVAVIAAQSQSRSHAQSQSCQGTDLHLFRVFGLLRSSTIPGTTRSINLRHARFVRPRVFWSGFRGHLRHIGRGYNCGYHCLHCISF